MGEKDEKAGLLSKLVIGKLDTSDIVGGRKDIKWFDVKNKNFWALQLNDVLLDGVSLGICK